MYYVFKVNKKFYMSVSAFEVAKYLLGLSVEDDDTISNLKLQKLLYYCQGYYIALTEGKEVLFNDEIQAWLYGPVFPEVYGYYKESNKNYSLPRPDESEFLEINKKLTLDQKKIIMSVYNRFKELSGEDLVYLTHQEDPWKNKEEEIVKTGNMNSVITKEDLYKFFKDKIER